jgi:formiminoglutamase
MRAPYTTVPLWPAFDPARFASNVHASPEGCRVALLGLPDDTGVRLNVGRPGAAAGPAALRRALAGYGVGYDAKRGAPLAVSVFDAGDVEPAAGHDEAALHETHRRVEAAARALQAAGLLVVAVGGGHDLTLPTVRALSRERGRAVGGVNLDAHLDVRKRVGSGMPFRSLLEGGFVDARAFVEVGLGRFANEQGDFEWLAAEGAELVMVGDATCDQGDCERWLRLAASAGAAFLSVDLDCLDAAVAPGVSARNPQGLSVAQVAAVCEAAGANPAFHHFDLMELCPERDDDGRTARVAAHLLLSFLAGFAARQP